MVTALKREGEQRQCLRPAARDTAALSLERLQHGEARGVQDFWSPLLAGPA